MQSLIQISVGDIFLWYRKNLIYHNLHLVDCRRLEVASWKPLRRNKYFNFIKCWRQQELLVIWTNSFFKRHIFSCSRLINLWLSAFLFKNETIKSSYLAKFTDMCLKSGLSWPKMKQHWILNSNILILILPLLSKWIFEWKNSVSHYLTFWLD